jgi:hypothetical protein
VPLGGYTFWLTRASIVPFLCLPSARQFCTQNVFHFIAIWSDGFVRFLLLLIVLLVRSTMFILCFMSLYGILYLYNNFHGLILIFYILNRSICYVRVTFLDSIFHYN